jgi:hypothetical protein
MEEAVRAKKLDSAGLLFRFVTQNHYKEFVSFYEALFVSMDNAIAKLKKRPLYAAQSGIIDGLMEVSMGGLLAGSRRRKSFMLETEDKVYDFFRKIEKMQNPLSLEGGFDKHSYYDISMSHRINYLYYDTASRTKNELFERVKDVSVRDALDMLSEMIDFVVMNAFRSENKSRLVEYLDGLYDRMSEKSFNGLRVGVHSCFIDDLFDRIRMCNSGVGPEREASLIYSLDDCMHIISMDAYMNNVNIGTIAKMFLLEVDDLEVDTDREMPEKVLLVDGVVAARTVGKIVAEGVKWQDIMYVALEKFCAVLGYPKVVVNVSHGTSQQSVQDFVRYVADKRGFKEGVDYRYLPDRGINVFRLTDDGMIRVGCKTFENGFKYTHRLRKKPLSSGLVQLLGDGSWGGETFLDSWYMWDSYDYLMAVKQKYCLESVDPFDILQFVKATPGLREDFASREFYWTKGDGCVLGIEIDSLSEYLDLEKRVSGMDDVMAEEIGSLVRTPPWSERDFWNLFGNRDEDYEDGVEEDEDGSSDEDWKWHDEQDDDLGSDSDDF